MGSITRTLHERNYTTPHTWASPYPVSDHGTVGHDALGTFDIYFDVPNDVPVGATGVSISFATRPSGAAFIEYTNNIPAGDTFQNIYLDSAYPYGDYYQNGPGATSLPYSYLSVSNGFQISLMFNSNRPSGPLITFANDVKNAAQGGATLTVQAQYTNYLGQEFTDTLGNTVRPDPSSVEDFRFTYTLTWTDPPVNIPAMGCDVGEAGTIACAWTSGAGNDNLKAAVCLAPTLGVWQASQALETSNDRPIRIGLSFLANGLLYLCYNKAGGPVYRISARSGLSGGWSVANITTADSYWMGGRGQLMAWRVRVSGASGSLEFCRDNQGVWGAGGSFSAAVVSPGVAAAFLGAQYGALFTRLSDNHILWTSSPNAATWATPTDTGQIGTVNGLARMDSGRLVGLVKISGAFYTLTSDDHGQTWALGGSAISLSSTHPPQILAILGNLYIICIVSDAPALHMSTDGGGTWT